MRAVVHHSFGDPAEVLAVETVPTPEPGPGQVRVRVLASPIHNHDLWTIRGTYGYRPELPARAGTEAAGVVDALGEGVEGLQVGQRVATVLVYLNEDYEGGETDFPELGLRHRGAKGDALAFFSVDAAGAPDPRTRHAGRPPASGEKWVLSQFIRDRRMVPAGAG